MSAWSKSITGDTILDNFEIVLLNGTTFSPTYVGSIERTCFSITCHIFVLLFASKRKESWVCEDSGLPLRVLVRLQMITVLLVGVG